MAPVGQVLGHELFSKTKMCKFHRAGKCAKGRQCPWAHDPSELQVAPDLRRTKLCKELIAKGHCTNAKCTFAHSQEECRTVAHAAGDVTHDIQATISQQKQVAVAKNSIGKASSAGQTSTMGVPDFVPSSLSADAPDFVPTSFTKAEPAFVPMLSPPPGLEDCMPYSPSSGYPSFHRELSESDSSSIDDIKIDGNTPISQILALSMAPKKKFFDRQLSSAQFASVSTAGSLADLHLSLEDVQL